ncbi:hypothetical protein J1614_006055 [Plenodomus biglobosus]|nr:hypothetical protein J1614_006055 [Plenodomus biglobosus]
MNYEAQSPNPHDNLGLVPDFSRADVGIHDQKNEAQAYNDDEQRELLSGLFRSSPYRSDVSDYYHQSRAYETLDADDASLFLDSPNPFKSLSTTASEVQQSYELAQQMPHANFATVDTHQLFPEPYQNVSFGNIGQPWSPANMRSHTIPWRPSVDGYLNPVCSSGQGSACETQTPSLLVTTMDPDMSRFELKDDNNDDTMDPWTTFRGMPAPCRMPSSTTTAASHQVLTERHEDSNDGSVALDETVEAPKIFWCALCKMQFTGKHSRGSFQRHTRLKHRPEATTYRCEDCNIVFKRADAKLKHMRVKHGLEAPIYRRKDCNEEFKRADAKLKHMRKVHPHSVGWSNATLRKPSLDDQVAEAETSQGTLDPLQHVCEEPGCSKRYARRGELLRHQRIHQSESERPHKCSVCDQAFLYPKDLHRHESTHEGANKSKYYCEAPMCSSGPGGSGFSRLDNLHRHMRHNHPDLASSLR